MFLTFLLDNKQSVIIIFMLAALIATAGYTNVLQSQKAALVAEKATLNTQLAESQANLLQLQSNIQAQNTAINAMKKEADDRVAKHATEVKQAQVVAQSYKQQAEDLLARQSNTTVSKCDAANSLINEVLTNAIK